MRIVSYEAVILAVVRMSHDRSTPSCTATGDNVIHTFSIVAADPDNGLLGSASASCALAVGAAVPHCRQGMGVVNAQHYCNQRIAEELLGKISDGQEPGQALQAVLATDSDAANRQIIAISQTGMKAAWTGRACAVPHAHLEGIHCVAAGNRLVSTSVVAAMVSAFDGTRAKPFPERLLLALEAGKQEGGDSLGCESAALLVIPKRRRETWPLNTVDIRVDHHVDPVCELRRIYRIAATRNNGFPT